MPVLTDAVKFARSIAVEDLPSQVFEIGKRALIDFVGVTLAGSIEPAAQSVATYLKAQPSRPESRIFGSQTLVSCESASLGNGVAGHALDYDDTSWTIIGHPTVTVAPAVFAFGEKNRLSGKQLIRAYAIGVEIQNKIGRLAMPEVSSRGWHTTGVFGPFGAAAASALIESIPDEKFISALGIAASAASGIRANFGTTTKAYHAGMAARNGVIAMQMANLGIIAREKAIEADDGFIEIFACKKPKKLESNFGDPWDILDPGLVFKRYPCCSGTHPAVDCLFDISRAIRFSAEEIESIQVGVSLLGLKELVCHSPSNSYEARFSMEYALAASIVHGKLGLSQFKSGVIQDPRIKKMIPLIEVETDPELADLGFVGSAPAKLRIALKDGRILSGKCDLAKGNPEKPLSDDELYSKFMECSMYVLPPEKGQKIFDELIKMEKIEDIRKITQLLQ